MSLISAYETQVKKAIDDWGRSITIVYGTSTTCAHCNTYYAYDPINKESTNVYCSTCSGKYYYDTENELEIKGVLKSFVTDMGSHDYLLHKFGYVPDEDGRLTCWLEDVLINTNSSVGRSYLDLDYNIRIEVDDKKYEVKSTKRTGIDDLKVVIATLKEIK